MKRKNMKTWIKSIKKVQLTFGTQKAKNWKKIKPKNSKIIQGIISYQSLARISD